MNYFFQEQTPALVSVDVLLLALVYISSREVLRPPHFLSTVKCRWITFLLFTFSLFTFYNTDWFHYQDLYEPLRMDYSTHVEPIYYFIAQKLSFDYLSWRFAIWGSGLILVLLTVKKLPLNYGLTLFLFAIISLPKYSYARVSLGMALIYFGLTVFYQKDKLINKVMGIALIWCSFYFHKTAIFGILMAVVVLVTRKMNRKAMLVLFAFSIPVIVYFMLSKLGNYLSMDVEYEAGGLEQTLAAGQKHMGMGAGVRGIGGLLQSYSERLTYIMAAIIGFRCIKNSAEFKISENMLALMKILLFIVVISMLFAMDFGVNMSVIHIRFIRFAIIPSALVISYAYEHNLCPTLTKWTIATSFFATSYALLYSLYNSTF